MGLCLIINNDVFTPVSERSKKELRGPRRGSDLDASKCKYCHLNHTMRTYVMFLSSMNKIHKVNGHLSSHIDMLKVHNIIGAFFNNVSNIGRTVDGFFVQNTVLWIVTSVAKEFLRRVALWHNYISNTPHTLWDMGYLLVSCTIGSG